MAARSRRMPISAVLLVTGLGLGIGSTANAATGPPQAALALGANVAWGTTVSAPAGLRGQLFGVTAGAPGDVWAVGGQNTGQTPTLALTRPYAEHWNGTSWTATRVPTPSVYPAGSQTTQLEGAASVGPSDVWAVGHIDNTSSLASRTLAYHWDGSAWSRVATPNPEGTTLGNRLFAVSARGANDVYAVGAAVSPLGHSS